MAEDARTSYAQPYGDVRVTFLGKPSPIRRVFDVVVQPLRAFNIRSCYAVIRLTQTPVIPCNASFAKGDTTEMDSVALPFTSSSNIGYNITPTFIVRIYQPPHASLAIPISLPTRPIKPHQHPEISSLKSLLMAFVSLFICIPSTRRAHVILLILSVSSLYLDHCPLVQKSSLRLTQPSFKLSPT